MDNRTLLFHATKSNLELGLRHGRPLARRTGRVALLRRRLERSLRAVHSELDELGERGGEVGKEGVLGSSAMLSAS